jgi:sucrose phosphorylase
VADRQESLPQRLREHLAVIYPSLDAGRLADELLEVMGLDSASPEPPRYENLWDEREVLLITYGNSILREGEKPLVTLHHFIREQLDATISAVHILPFFPFSSDDGFAVIDYLSVNPSLGDWDDIAAVAGDYRLMADVVLNHASRRSRWFDNFRKRVDPGRDFFVEGDPQGDYSAVVRPRSSRLIETVQTTEGERHVWCTFGPDQVDLDFANPRVLAEFVGILRHYLERGVKLFRLDAVAFLWKAPGTSCVHRPETHEIVRLLRTLLEHHSPGAILVTETNVPNRENLTYFGNANEAHWIYNFSLPPLLLHTLVSGDCQHLKTWMMSMPPARNGTAYLNFIASHDGIGLRPLDGLLSDGEQHNLLEGMRRFGGRVTTRRSREGTEKPYELNISLFDALQGTLDNGPDGHQLQRFLCAHAIMMALEGIPAVYVHSFFGTGNDYRRLEHTGRNRAINRHIWQWDELHAALADKARHHGAVFAGLRHLLAVRRRQAAFHPNATQYTLHLGTRVFGFWRQSMDRSQSIFCVSNVTPESRTVRLADINLISTDRWWDLIAGTEVDLAAPALQLEPYQTVWMSNLNNE